MPLKFSDRVRRALKKDPLNIKHLKKLASMEEGSSIIAIAIYGKCSVETIQVLIKEGCGDVNGEYLNKKALEWAWRYDNNNIFDVLIESGASELSISKLNYNYIFEADRTLNVRKMINMILCYFPHQIIPLLKLSINDISFHCTIKQKFTTRQIILFEFLFKKGFQFYRSLLLDDDSWEPLDNIFNNNFIESSNQLFCSKLGPWVKKFYGVMNFRKNIMPKFHLLYKIRMVYHTHFVKEHFYKKDCSSIDHLPTPLQNRIHQLPEVKYPVEGVSAYPGGEMEKGIGMNSKMIFQQEIIYQVANMKTDLFREVCQYLMSGVVNI